MRDYSYLKKYQFKKGGVPHNAGVYPKKKHCVVCEKEFLLTVFESRTKKTCSNKCRYELLSKKFSKERIGYSGIHMWAKTKLGTPNECQYCGKIATGHNIHWANISGEYKKDSSDWIRLCVPCHSKYDRSRK